MEPLDPEDEKRLTAALVRMYDDEQQARKLLREIGYPTQPEWRDSGLFWSVIVAELSKGKLLDGLSRLIDVVSADFPGNTTFLEFKRRLHGDDPPPPPPPPPPPAARLNPNGSLGPAVVLSVPVEDLSVEALQRRLAEVQHVPSAPRPPAPALSLAELEAAGVIDALADCYDTHLAATTLLHRAGVPSGRLPQIGHGTMADWWRLTLRELNKGVTEGGIGPVLSLAAQGYPGNRTLKAYR